MGQMLSAALLRVCLLQACLLIMTLQSGFGKPTGAACAGLRIEIAARISLTHRHSGLDFRHKLQKFPHSSPGTAIIRHDAATKQHNSS